ncbi:HlyD family secretion protein [Brevundimonas vancanneytii]|uniref:Inner membrane protein yibH n=1 Tax=Brevundimonas vancanneytii TaxID=1325724 RepID=A0A4P1KBK5_9CAUL|nr:MULTISPECIES: HlyD family secretion protein [Brevundimonas]VTO16839.1 Inner membrane protein yibH [Brevundimonas vancanneytii]VTO17799.1 Inner membrane protein yibH [Brevundimonas vancanneytii]
MTDQPQNTPTQPSPQPEDEGLETLTQVESKPKNKGLPKAAIITAVLALAAVLLVLFVWKLPPFSSPVERTENAYVRGQVTVVAPQVNGYITEVLVKDFQNVTKGQPLFRIDDRIYAQRLEQAKANLASAESQLANSAQTTASREATVSARSAELASARAELARAQADMARVSELAEDGSVSLRERDQAMATLRTAEARVGQVQANIEVARQDVRATGVSRGGLEAAVEAARAAVRLAEIDLANTVIVAPEAGQVGQVGARLGQYVTAGSQLVSLVPPQLWVIANFKERQVGKMLAGQKVTVTVDALGDREFTGRIESISPATGSEFAVLPAQNATGNFTKISQRLPLRILLDSGQQGLDKLRPGLSVVARVDTASARESR